MPPSGVYWAADEASRWAAAVRANGGAVSNARLNLVRKLIRDYKACGWWDLMDDAALLVAENAGQALTSLKGRRLMATVASPTFAADTGYAFNGTTQYVNSGFVPSTMASKMAFGNVRVSTYERTNVASNTNSMGAGATTGSQSTFTQRPRNASDVCLFQVMSSANSTTITGITDSRGLTAQSRAAGATTGKTWKNGVALSDVTGLTANNTQLPDVAIYIGCNNNAGTAAGFRASTIGYVDWGAPLPTTAQELAAYTALQSFMTGANGANV